MGKRGRKTNKSKQNQPSSLQTNDVGTEAPALVDKSISTIKKDIVGSDKITNYFPASPKTLTVASSKGDVNGLDYEKTMTSLILENIPGVLTPETTPTKKQDKTPPSTDTPDVRVTVSHQPAAEKTDSPEHKKKSVPNSIAASQRKSHERSQPVAATGIGGDKGETAKGEMKESTGTKGKRGKSSRQRKSRSAKEPSIQTNTLKDYFPVRRSNRRCKSEIEAEQNQDIQDAILSIREDGLEVSDIEGKGRGVVSTKPFRKGDFVVEYYGDLINTTKAKEREADYLKDPSIGCYMYYFQFKNKQYCIDATAESGRLGRLLNHSTKTNNCCTKLVEFKGKPHLIIVAATDIQEGEELLYDYGDRNKESLQAHPWLAL